MASILNICRHWTIPSASSPSLAPPPPYLALPASQHLHRRRRLLHQDPHTCSLAHELLCFLTRHRKQQHHRGPCVVEHHQDQPQWHSSRPSTSSCSSHRLTAPATRSPMHPTGSSRWSTCTSPVSPSPASFPDGHLANIPWPELRGAMAFPT
ncbi:uncharacterized protein LOC119283524 [Triticum dicoccoides]|uniref:uncharacterized protein LOC119283524 n=1 Tax=Triticum dicoccoides TaxID=85692 RepID=UPI00188E03B9|nr:uncharacterized protein LOC119283524 [Triticum dicoccoides]